VTSCLQPPLCLLSLLRKWKRGWWAGEEHGGGGGGGQTAERVCGGSARALVLMPLHPEVRKAARGPCRSPGSGRAVQGVLWSLLWSMFWVSGFVRRVVRQAGHPPSSAPAIARHPAAQPAPCPGTTPGLGVLLESPNTPPQILGPEKQPRACTPLLTAAADICTPSIHAGQQSCLGLAPSQCPPPISFAAFRL